MPIVIYIDSVGVERATEVAVGQSVMDAAIKHNVPGIDADCGGACACATCQVYVDRAWLAKLGAPSPTEASMLDFAIGARPNSRLACQITITAELDGLRVTTPATQR